METKNISVQRRRPQELQDICLSALADNFEKILPKLNPRAVEVLLRKWSQELLKKCTERNVPSNWTLLAVKRYAKKLHFDFQYRAERRVVEERKWAIPLKCARFFINCYEKKLELNCFEARNLPVIIRKLGKMESTLTDISIEFLKPSKKVLWQLVRSLPQTLKFLNVADTCCNDDMLKTIARNCPLLENLNLYECKKISDHGVQFLCCKNKEGSICPNLALKNLEVSLSNVTRTGIEFALEKFPNLSELDHQDLYRIVYKMHNSDLFDGTLKNVTYNLKSLDFVAKDLYPFRSFELFVTLFPLVTKLRIEIVGQGNINACAEYTHLEEVYIGFYSVSSCDASPFIEARGKALKILSMWSTGEFFVSVQSLVKFCPRLEYMCLVRPKFEKVKLLPDQDLKCTLPYLKQLEVLEAHQDNLEESLVYLLSRCPNLEKFKFKNEEYAYRSTSFTDAFACLQGMASLNELTIKGIDVNVMELSVAMPDFSGW